MFGLQLGDILDIREVSAPVAAGPTIDDNTDRVDMAGAEGVVFVQPIEDSVNTGVATVTAEQNSADSDTGMAALAGAVATATSGGDDDLNGQLLIVSVHQPRERYVQLQRASLTANIAYGTCIAIRYGRKKHPLTEHATVSDSAHVTSPAEA